MNQNNSTKIPSKTAVIIGAGPAGLTAAYELATRTDIKPIIFEASDCVGGISRTVNYKGNRMDIGGHRFFSKSDRVMEWWQNIFPIQSTDQFDSSNNNQTKVFLVRNRVSRIYYNNKFFDYPISLSLNLVNNLGLTKTIKIALTYMFVKLRSRHPENSLEDFYVNHFGQELYKTFFENYSTKLWGIHPSKIDAEWGRQRVKGVSVSKTLSTALKNIMKKSVHISQKDTETSLIRQFLYPKFGPGQLWEEVALRTINSGGELHYRHKVEGLQHHNGMVEGIYVRNLQTNQVTFVNTDYIFSSMSVPELIAGLSPEAPKRVINVAEGLGFRDFVSVGILLEKLTVASNDPEENLISDNWIYIHDPAANFLRIQIFNNWSPALVKDPTKVWLGLEYVCDYKDSLWKLNNDAVIQHAIHELEAINFAKSENVIDAHVVRLKKVYPIYSGLYEEFPLIRGYLDNFENLFLIGRNGTHRYNNQDHSMLTAMTAVDNIIRGVSSKENIWEVNTEEEYHEEQSQKFCYNTP